MSEEKLSIEETISYFKVIDKSEDETIREVERLINLGEDVNYQLDGCSTAALTSAAQGYVKLLKLLIENGADITLKNRWKEDIKACAKLSENKEMIAFVNAQLKLMTGLVPVVCVYYKPKKNTEAEYTFTPNKKYKNECESDENDVGYFLNDSEVLVLEPTKPATLSKSGFLVFAISEGKVSILSDAWEELSIKKYETLAKNGKATAHDIECIRREYRSQ